MVRNVLCEQCTVLHKMLLEAIAQDETRHHLMTVSGFGAVIALTFLVFIDDLEHVSPARLVISTSP